MTQQTQVYYDKIEEAIQFINVHHKEQPSLNEIARAVNLSPFHFQRLFTEWAGVSPKMFMQYISIEHAKKLLKEKRSSLFDTAHETGLSGTGRLHDLFIKIEGMTPGEFKNGGLNLTINYSFTESQFGNLIVASTPKGICYMAFTDNEQHALAKLKLNFPNAKYNQFMDNFQKDALSVFRQDRNSIKQIKLHLYGTSFRIKVWEALLKIPFGNLSTYGSIAEEAGMPGASRAVGTAIGKNPVAFLIPCHRVILSSGNFGGYMWGGTRKSAIIGWEAAKIRQYTD